MTLAVINAQCSDDQLIETLKLERVDEIEVTGYPKTLDDLTRIQAYCDAFHIGATWTFDRHARKVFVKLQRPDPQLDLDGAA